MSEIVTKGTLKKIPKVLIEFAQTINDFSSDMNGALCDYRNLISTLREVWEDETYDTFCKEITPWFDSIEKQRKKLEAIAQNAKETAERIEKKLKDI